MAAKLGKTLRELLLSLDSRELSEWMVYENLEGWKKYLKEKHMTEKERSDELKSLMFRGAKIDND